MSTTPVTETPGTYAVLLPLEQVGIVPVIVVDDAEHVDWVVDADASFVVSPGFSLDAVERCRHHNVAVIPGIATATELQAAVVAGLSHVKFFPAGKLSGRPLIETLAALFPDVRFMPSGGVSAANLTDYVGQPVDRRGRRQLDGHAVTHREPAIRFIEISCHGKA